MNTSLLDQASSVAVATPSAAATSGILLGCPQTFFKG